MDWFTQFGQFTSTALVIAGVIGWYIKLKMKDVKQDICDIKKDIKEVAAETKTNGGSSMRDEIKAIKKEQEEAKQVRQETNKKIDHLYEVLIDYISRNSK